MKKYELKVVQDNDVEKLNDDRKMKFLTKGWTWL